MIISNCYKKTAKLGVLIDSILVILIFFPSSLLFAIQSDEDKIGFFNFDNLTLEWGSEPENRLSLNKFALNALSNLVDSEEESGFLLKLDHVSIVRYEFEFDNFPTIDDELVRIDRDLAVIGWDRVLMRQLDRQFSALYLKRPQRLSVAGVVLIALEGDKALLVNIVGALNQSELNQIGRYFEIGELETLKLTR
mgnify:CR=1 FL=1